MSPEKQKANHSAQTHGGSTRKLGSGSSAKTDAAPFAVNLAEGLALSEFISSLPEDERPADHEALEAFRAAQRDAANED